MKEIEIDRNYGELPKLREVRLLNKGVVILVDFGDALYRAWWSSRITLPSLSDVPLHSYFCIKSLHPEVEEGDILYGTWWDNEGVYGAFYPLREAYPLLYLLYGAEGVEQARLSLREAWGIRLAGITERVDDFILCKVFLDGRRGKIEDVMTKHHEEQLRAIGKNLIIKRFVADKVGGIYLPDTTHWATGIGQVISVGKGVTDVAEGDFVVYSRHYLKMLPTKDNEGNNLGVIPMDAVYFVCTEAPTLEDVKAYLKYAYE